MILMPVIVPFFQEQGLEMKEIFLLQSIFSGALFLFEVPSGYISDLLGRKNTLIIGSALSGIGFTLFAFVSGFIGLSIAEVILALAVSFVSGTDTALLYDTMNAAGVKKAPIKYTGKMIFYMGLGEAAASIVGGLLVLISIRVTLYAHIAVSWLPVMVAMTFVEPDRPLMDKKKHKDNFKYILKSMFGQSRLLTLVVLNIIFYSISSLFAVWMFQKYWQEIHIPIAYFGYLWALSNLTVAITGRYAHKVEKKIGSELSLLIIGVIPIAGYLGIGFFESMIGVFFCFIFQACRGLTRVILVDALNKRTTGDIRASVNSICALFGRIIFCVFGPIAGYFIDTKGISATSYAFAVVYICIFIGLLIPLLKKRDEFAPIG